MIVVKQDGGAAQVFGYDNTDQVAEEGKNRAVTIIEGPKYVAPPQPNPPPTNITHKPEQRLPSIPPIKPIPDKHGPPKYIELPRVYYGQIQNLPPLRNPYPKQLKLQHAPNTIYKYHKVIPMQPPRNQYNGNQQPLVFSASTIKPSVNSNGPKFSVPVETINGIKSDFVRPPHFANTPSSTTTVATTTTKKYLRTKRIWPKHVQKRYNTAPNTTLSPNSTSSNDTTANNDEFQSSQSRIRYVYTNQTASTTPQPSTTRKYQRVTRVSKKKYTTPSPANFTQFEPNDWVPMVPSHYPLNKVRKTRQTPMSRRSDVFFYDAPERNAQNKQVMYLHSFGLIPVASAQNPVVAGRRYVHVRKGKQLNQHVYSRSRRRPLAHTSHVIGDYQADADSPRIVTRIKHHHHHHHHRYIKTVDKPVKVEVPKPVPFPVPMPVPVKVEQKVPYPVQVKVPHPVPVKVVEKEYIPKPYPVIQQVPVVKQVQVEKKVPYPVQVEVPRPYPVAVHVEKRVPYPVPVKVMVPQPYPVEKRVPYPVTVKEPVEVIKHVPVKVPVPQPYPVKVPQPVPVAVEKKVPYPVEVEKKVPVPYKVFVPEKVPVEKRVPVYVPRPYPVEKKVPVPVRVPYPVRVPIKVPYGIPILIHPSPINEEYPVSGSMTVSNNNGQPSLSHSHYSFEVNGNDVSNSVTDFPQHTVTFHGNTVTDSAGNTATVHGLGYNGFQSRSDTLEHSTKPYGDTEATIETSGSNGSQLVSDETTTPTFAFR